MFVCATLAHACTVVLIWILQTPIRVVFCQQEEQVCLGRNGATLQKASQHRRGSQPIWFLQNAGIDENES